MRPRDRFDLALALAVNVALCAVWFIWLMRG